MQGPFRGVRILDCSEGIGGPLAAMLLGDLGADVIKVEPPAGDRLRGTPAFHVLNRSKRGLVADLRSDAGRRRLAPLLRDADVLILGGPPSTYAERGLDPESLHRTHPQLIVVQVPMYGRQGPFVDLQEDDAMLSALCGPVGTQPSHSGRPVYQTLPASSAGQGILTALTIGACLVNRERTGRGDGVEVSGLTAGYAFMASLAIPDVAPAVERLTNPRFAYPTYGFHQGSDGQWFFIGAIGIRDWVRIANALGLDDFLNDPAFSAGVLGVERPEDARRLLEKLEAIFRTQPRAHWLQVMIDADVAVGPLQSHEEFMQEEQVQHIGMVANVEDAELGPTQQLGLPIIASRTPGAIQGGAPRLDPAAAPPTWTVPIEPRGGDGGNGMAAELAGRDLPLSGFVVLDIATWVAGSYAPTLLADLGANVVKAEAPDGDPYRPMAVGYYAGNRNKRSLAVDLKAEGGRAALDRMIAGSDIVLTNLRPGPRQRLGLDYESLQRVNPDIVSVGVWTNGPAGPLKDRPAYDQVFQARSGAAWQQCGGDGEEPAIITGAPNDHTTASLAALAAVAGLYERTRHGGGQELSTSLLQASMAVAAREFISYPGRPPSPMGGQDALGITALQRNYECSDGEWIYLSVKRPQEWDALTRLWSEEDWPAQWSAEQALAEPVTGDLAEAIARRMAEAPRDTGVAKLHAAGVACMPCLRRPELFDHPHPAANASYTALSYPGIGGVRQVGRFARFRGGDPPPITAAAQLGEHSAEVLREFGMDAREIEQLISTGVVLSAEGSQVGQAR